MNIKELLEQKGRIFIIPIDHPMGFDTPKLQLKGKQNFINEVDNFNQDGYIFHSYDYTKNPFKTKKDFFLTVGELPDNYKLDIEKLKTFPEVKNVTIYFDVNGVKDEEPYKFYKDYVFELKKQGYFVMAMAFPSDELEEDINNYIHTIDIASRLGCDALKTHFFTGIEKLDLKGMYLFIGGGDLIVDESEFDSFIGKVGDLKIASYSFGRNIFEADNYVERINKITGIIN